MLIDREKLLEALGAVRLEDVTDPKATVRRIVFEQDAVTTEDVLRKIKEKCDGIWKCPECPYYNSQMAECRLRHDPYCWRLGATMEGTTWLK